MFDDLPGKGKPLNMKPGAADGDYGEAWVRDYARREGVPARRCCRPRCGCGGRSSGWPGTAGEFRSEAEVREAAADINRRIVEWRRIPVGPPVHVRLVNADDLVARWRAARAARAAADREAAGRRRQDPRPSTTPRRGRRRRWRRRARRGRRPRWSAEG